MVDIGSFLTGAGVALSLAVVAMSYIGERFRKAIKATNEFHALRQQETSASIAAMRNAQDVWYGAVDRRRREDFGYPELLMVRRDEPWTGTPLIERPDYPMLIVIDVFIVNGCRPYRLVEGDHVVVTGVPVDGNGLVHVLYIVPPRRRTVTAPFWMIIDLVLAYGVRVVDDEDRMGCDAEEGFTLHEFSAEDGPYRFYDPEPEEAPDEVLHAPAIAGTPLGPRRRVLKIPKK